MKEEMNFLGQPIRYWLELKRIHEEKNDEHLIREIADLRSKVSFYESRISELSKFMKENLEVRP